MRGAEAVDGDGGVHLAGHEGGGALDVGGVQLLGVVAGVAQVGNFSDVGREVELGCLHHGTRALLQRRAGEIPELPALQEERGSRRVN